jgi:hypothetical protein
MRAAATFPNPDRASRSDLVQKTAAVHSRCVLCRNGLHGKELFVRFPSLFHKHLHPLPRIYGFLRELHSFVHRMITIWTLGYRGYWVYVGLCPDRSIGHQEASIRRPACIADIRNFVLNHPWATSLDLQTYVAAWHAGAEWQTDTFRKECPETARDLTCNTPAL